MMLLNSSSFNNKPIRGVLHTVTVPYFAFVIMASPVYYILSDGLSSLLTLSAALQALGFALLVLKVRGQSSVSGISARMLGMYSLTEALRLSSTLWLEGYLPSDATGDWLYQCLELLSLVLAFVLMRHVVTKRRTTYAHGAAQEEQDSMPGLPCVVLACSTLAVFLHADLNQNPVFDVIWTTACYIETAAMLPQLWMMSKAKGEVEALTGHFVALTALARLCSLTFWYLAMDPSPAEAAVVGAHVLQLVLSCDFLFLYITSFAKQVPLHASSQWL